MITFFSLVILTLLLILFEKVQESKKTSPGKTLFLQVISLIKWSFPIVLIAFNIDYIIFCASLQFSSGHISASLNKLGILFCLIFLLLGGALLFGIYYVVKQTSFASLQTKEDDAKISRTYTSVYVLYGGYRQEDVFTRYFYLIYIIRVALPSIIACALYSCPIAQTILYLMISACMLVFVVYKRPLTKKINHFQLIIQEVLNSLINFFLVVLVSLNKDALKHLRSIEILGDAVVVTNSLLNTVAIVFLVLKVSIEGHKMWKLRKTENCFTSGAWTSFISIYVQQAAFGFEEIAQDRGVSQNGIRYIYPDASVHAVFAKDLNYAPSLPLPQENLDTLCRSQKANNEVNMQIAGNQDQDYTTKPSRYPDFPKSLYPDLPPPNYFPQFSNLNIGQPLYPVLPQPVQEYDQDAGAKNNNVIDVDPIIHNQHVVLKIVPNIINIAQNTLVQQAEDTCIFRESFSHNKSPINLAGADKEDNVGKS